MFPFWCKNSKFVTILLQKFAKMCPIMVKIWKKGYTLLDLATQFGLSHSILNFQVAYVTEVVRNNWNFYKILGWDTKLSANPSHFVLYWLWKRLRFVLFSTTFCFLFYAQTPVHTLHFPSSVRLVHTESDNVS